MGYGDILGCITLYKPTLIGYKKMIVKSEFSVHLWKEDNASNHQKDSSRVSVHGNQLLVLQLKWKEDHTAYVYIDYLYVNLKAILRHSNMRYASGAKILSHQANKISSTKISPVMLQGNPLDLEVKQHLHTSVQQHSDDSTKSWSTLQKHEWYEWTLSQGPYIYNI